MSKKDKSKFRKRIKAQLLQEMVQTSPGQKSITPSPIKTTVLKPTQPTVNDAVQARPTSPKVATTAAKSDESLNYIKKDLKKSAIIIGSIIILIFALSVINTKTNILLKAGDQVFKVFHINS